VEVNHAVAEASFGQQIEPQQNVVRLGLLAASHQDGRDNQVVFVHQPGLNRMGGEAGSSHCDARSASIFVCRTASGSKSRSIRVLALETISNVLEYTNLSAARQISAKSRGGDLADGYCSKT
jgi:hypothetical protein